MSGTDRRILVVGAGITGLTTAATLVGVPGVRVTVLEASPRLGGKIATSPFAGLPAVDEGADAFLARQPEAVALAEQLGLGARLTSPTAAGAAVWHDGLHPIPDGLVLGVPASVLPFARTRLLSWRGKARAAVEPLLPRTSVDDDAIGAFVRARFGDEVHERLVDALVGSIYAADTDHFSLAAVPQLAALAGGSRSVLLGARAARRRAAAAPAGPLFAAPLDGMAALVDAAARAVVDGGGTIRTSTPVERIERDGGAWRVDDEPFDAVAVTAPARAAAPMLAGVAPDASELLGSIDQVDVAIVTLHLPAEPWPGHLLGRSGYLVPKPDQGLVTAASFGSQKWAHWRPPGGGQVVRVSLGRDGLPVGHLDDDRITAAAIDELGRHVGIDVAPLEVRVTRWAGAFPQHRPHHAERVAAVRAALPQGVVTGGASHDGIGIPACVRQGRAMAEALSRATAPAR